MSTYDIGIIGGGPGGYVAAIKAAQLRGSVCLIEKGEWGGTCLNRGCIPTKTLYAVANLATQVQEAPDFGVHISGETTIDYPQVLTHKNSVIQQLTGGIAQLLKANKVDTFNGTGTLTDRNTVIVSKPDGTTEQLHAKNIIIATGSEPADPPIFEIDEEHVLTTTGILNLTELPESLLIVGRRGFRMRVRFNFQRTRLQGDRVRTPPDNFSNRRCPSHPSYPTFHEAKRHRSPHEC